MNNGSRTILLSVGAVIFFVLVNGVNGDLRGKEDSKGLKDKSIPSYQVELLDLAIQTATAIPVNPHIKDRSRAQEAVAAACFELDQPTKALACIEKIDNWRRGAGYADFAYYCAQHKTDADLMRYLDLAHQVMKKNMGGNTQAWRMDQVKSKIARAHIWMGQKKEAAFIAKGLEDSEIARLDVVQVKLLDENAFEAKVKALDGVIALGNFEHLRNALNTYAHLFNRFYNHKDKRLLLETKIKAAWGKLPLTICVNITMNMAGYALDHGDKAKALELVNEAQGLINSGKWRPNYRIPMMARVAKLFYRCDKKELAKIEADSAWELFNSEREKIINIYRARTLQPLGEAYHCMGLRDQALKVYKKAVEEGIVNINSRPRAEDLSATCCSMALIGFEPDEKLWSRIRQIYKDLGSPW